MTNDIKYYTSEIDNFYKGASTISKVFLGPTQVWPGCVSEYWISSLNNSDSEGVGVAVDDSGNVYISGYCSNYLMFLAKYDFMGELVWQRTINSEDVPTNYLDVGNKLVLDGSGNLYIVGYSYLQNIESGVFVSGQSDQVLIIKCDNEGVVQWKRRLGVPWDCRGEDVVIDNVGNIYVTGSVKRVYPIADAILLAKYDNDGNLQWQKMLTESYGDSNIFPGNATTQLGYRGTGILLDGNGDLCLIGNGATQNTPNSKLILAKYDTDGNPLWSTSLTYDGNYYTAGNAFTLDDNGNIYLTGYAYSQDLNIEGLLVAKFNGSGVSQWQRVLTGGYYGSIGNSIKLGPNGKLYITGGTYDNDGVSSTLVASLSDSGYLLWQRKIIRDSESAGYSLSLGGANSICLTGWSKTSGDSYKLLAARLPLDGSLIGVYTNVSYELTELQNNSVELTVTPVELIDRAPFLNEAATALSSISASADELSPSSTGSSLSLNSLSIANWSSGLENYWITALENSNTGLLSDVATDNSGNFYVAGVAYGSDSYPVLVKYDSNGVLQWQKTLTGMQSAEFSGVVTDASGNIYAYGTYYPVSIPGQYNTSLIIVKYNSSGVIQWQRQIGDPSLASFTGAKIAIDSSGNLYCAGSVGNDGILIKCDSSGSVVWQKQLVSASGETDLTGVSVDSSGNIYVTGNTYISYSTGSYNTLVAKYSNSGTLLWQRRLGGIGFDIGYAITVDASGKSYVTGECSFYSSYYSGEVLAARYNTDGEIEWQRSLSGPSVPFGRGIALDGDGNLYIVGYLSPGIVIIKYDSLGNLEWERSITLTSGLGVSPYQFGITVDDSGNIYVAGSLVLSYSPANCYMLSAKLPPDGSITGTYGNVVYSEVSMTEYPLIPEDATTTLTEATSSINSDKVGLCQGPAICDEPPFFCSTNVNPYCVTDFSQAWSSCSNLTSFPFVDVNSGTNFSSAWQYCINVTYFPLLDVSNGIDFEYAWGSCLSLTSFPPLDVSSGTNFGYAWASCESLTSFPLLDVSNGTNFYAAWGVCESLTSFPLLDVSNGTDFTLAWYNCTSLTTFPSIVFASGTNFSSAWYNCTSLTTFPSIYCGLGVNFSSAWYNCYNLTSFPVIDTGSGTNFTTAWSICSSLTSFPTLDVSNGTNFGGTWLGCNSLASFPVLDVGNGTDFYRTWRDCYALTSFPALTFSSATYMRETWCNCTSLVDFPAGVFDDCPATNFIEAWRNCALSQTSVDNILISLDTANQINGIVHLDGGTSSAPGPAGLAAKASLQAKGWSISTN